MKIRKTFAGNLPDNKIVNSNSTSETDTYSCKYLNERNVIVSSEEPTTGEEVWLQKGKNLFDKSNVSFPYCWLEADGTIGTTINQDAVSEYIKVTPNTTYTISGFANNQYFNLQSYDKNKNHLNMIYDTTLTNGEDITFVTGGNDYYIRIAINIFDVSNNIQIEKGSVATAYEPYIIKKIHTKIDNSYEEFYSEENREVYSKEEQIIGIYLGKPLYRKVIQGVLDGTYTENGMFYSWFSHKIGNLGIVTELRVSATSIKTEGRVYTSSGSSSVINCCVSGTAIQVGASIDHFDNQVVANAIIEYTKTND